MRIRLAIVLVALAALWTAGGGYGQHSAVRTPAASMGGALALEGVLAGVESRYAPAGFSARFFQESTLKAMAITDSAGGQIYVKRPGKMRWEYDHPEKQVIITDGQKLWIYRPEENQVIIGKAPSFFGDGKGAGFLSDMRQIRDEFDIVLEKTEPQHYVLELTPRRQSPDIARISLSVAREDFAIDSIATYNAYGDETRITLSDLRFQENPADSLFRFEVPEGADVLQLDE